MRLLVRRVDIICSQCQLVHLFLYLLLIAYHLLLKILLIRQETHIYLVIIINNMYCTNDILWCRHDIFGDTNTSRAATICIIAAALQNLLYEVIDIGSCIAVLGWIKIKIIIIIVMEILKSRHRCLRRLCLQIGQLLYLSGTVASGVLVEVSTSRWLKSIGYRRGTLLQQQLLLLLLFDSHQFAKPFVDVVLVLKIETIRVSAQFIC